MNSPAKRRLIKDLERIQQANNDQFVAAPVQDNLMLWTAYIEGAEGTPWEGGIFTLKLHFTENYPNQPPQVRFLTKMFHPNIYNDGRICLDMLYKQWSSVYDVWAIVTAIKSLLSDPNTQSPANIEASNIFKQNKTLYEIKVKQCVEQSLEDRDYEAQAIEQALIDQKKLCEEEKKQVAIKTVEEKREQSPLPGLLSPDLLTLFRTQRRNFINYPVLQPFLAQHSVQTITINQSDQPQQNQQDQSQLLSQGESEAKNQEEEEQNSDDESFQEMEVGEEEAEINELNRSENENSEGDKEECHEKEEKQGQQEQEEVLQQPREQKQAEEEEDVWVSKSEQEPSGEDEQVVEEDKVEEQVQE